MYIPVADGKTKVWTSQNPWLTELPGSGICAQLGGSDDTPGSGLLIRLSNISSHSTLADTDHQVSVQQRKKGFFP